MKTPINPRNHHQHEEDIAVVGREYRCLFRREVDSGYRVTCAELPPVLAFGETLEEARVNTREEIEAWVEMAEVSADYITRFR
jgi:predicted RNase H-like HicB family nuclease